MRNEVRDHPETSIGSVTLTVATDTSSPVFALAETLVDTAVVSGSAREGIIKAGTSGVPGVEAASAFNYKLPYGGEQKSVRI